MDMDVSALIDDLRSRINPAYANMIGTESYERRLCAEAMEAQKKEIEQLRADAERYRRLCHLVELGCYSFLQHTVVKPHGLVRVRIEGKPGMDSLLDNPDIVSMAEE